MQIQLNGEAKSLTAACTLADLIATEAPHATRIAVERNGAIVPRSQYAQTTLEDGDILEIVIAVGGG